MPVIQRRQSRWMMTESGLRSGQLTELAPGVRRLVAPNGGVMTGPGTNSYLIGRESVALLDPGPLDAGHMARLQDACAGRCRWVLTTHTHADHSPAAAPLAAALGARLVGMPPPQEGPQDRSFVPDHVPVDGESLRIDDLQLTAIHTPGHASNHVCWLLQPGGWLFTGDHIMAGSTVVIAPPDGNMNAYLASLRRLHELPLTRLAPGHGEVLENPAAVVDWIIDHRLRREARVVAALAARHDASVDELLAEVYADTAPSLHGLARLSLRAHLEKLVEDGRAQAREVAGAARFSMRAD